MKLPLGRLLRTSDYRFVQAVSSPWAVEGGRVSLIEDLDCLASDSFDPERIDPVLRRFYEGAGGHRMTVEWLRWEPWATVLALGYVPLARRLGNLCVPDRIDRPCRMSSMVQRVRLADGSESRRWTRSFTGTSRLFYSAGLRPWVDPSGAASYLSVAFPMAAAQVLVMLQVRNEDGGMVCSTRPPGLAGTYLVLPRRRHFVALPGPPTDEVLSFTVGEGVVRTLHEDFLGCRRTFAVSYRIEPDVGGR